MTISSIVDRIDYTGTGAVATYSFPFKIFEADDLLVTIADLTGAETVQVITTNYTVAVATPPSIGGSITLVAGNLTTDYKLTIRRDIAILQSDDFRNQGEFFAENHEDTYDKSRMIDQSLVDLIRRSAQLQETDSDGGIDPVLPVAVASGIPGLNPAKDGWKWFTAGDFAAAAVSGNVSVQQFVDTVDWATGVTTLFTLSADPGSENNTQIFIDGVYQEKTLYSQAGAALTFAVAPTGTLLEVVYNGSVDIGTPSDGTVTSIKIAADAVDDTKIADNSIGNEHMQDNSIDSDEYVDGSIDTEHLNDAIVRSAHFGDRAVKPNSQGWIALEFELNTPPGSPSAHDGYIVGPAPTGAWVGQGGSFAWWDPDAGPAAWDYITPADGMVVSVTENGETYHYHNLQWRQASRNMHKYGDGNQGTLDVVVNTTLSNGNLRQYTNVIVRAGITLTFDSGVQDLRIQGNLELEAGAVIECNRALSGGQGSGSAFATGNPGEVAYSDVYPWNTGGGGGVKSAGGGGGGGGGAGYETDGGAGVTASAGAGGVGGVSYMKDNNSFYPSPADLVVSGLDAVYHNRPSGGGAGASGDVNLEPGGDAGGNLLIFVGGKVFGAGTIKVSGGDGTYGGGGNGGGGGGGAGFLFIVCEEDISDIAAEADGGIGALSGTGYGNGGGGGGGEIRLISRLGFSGVTTSAIAGASTGGTPGGAGSANTITDEPRRYYL